MISRSPRFQFRFSEFGFRVSLVLLLFFLAGCTVSRPTPQQRADSFAPLAGQQIAGQRLDEYLRLRTAFVVTGTKPVLVEHNGSQTHIRLALDLRLTLEKHKPTELALSYGSAAALTSDGYFLTAAHCIEDRDSAKGREVYIVYAHGPLAGRILPARVVWTPPGGRRNPDFAILKVDVADMPYFPLAPSADELFRDDTPVAGYGPYGPAGGRITNSSSFREGDRDDAQTVRYLDHTIPLYVGDSGGPLINTQGQLLGVSYAKHMLTRTAQAIRPDPQWLQRLLDARK